MEMLDDLKKVSNDFQKGYREGRSGKYNAVVVAILIVVVLYFFKSGLAFLYLIG